jgi:hypothetical protein
MKHSRRNQFFILLMLCALMAMMACAEKRAVPEAAPEKALVKIDWGKVDAVSKLTTTLQVVVNPPLRRGSRIHDRVFQALHDLGCDYVRYVPWVPYPKLGVAELEPPQDGKTSWDFSLIDPITEDFMKATAGHSVIFNFSTIPEWMFKTESPVRYPKDPDQVFWEYPKGSEFRDPTLKEVADYYARLVSWYTLGGFTDEYGKRHDSGHHYKIDFWEVLNEVDSEHRMTPQTYTRVYDALVAAIHNVQPQIKFVGLALAFTAGRPQYFEYFLNPKNHRPGIPLDTISYHFYASPSRDEPADAKPYNFFAQANSFLFTVRYIEMIRQRLSPPTRTNIDEIGSIDSSDAGQDQPGYVYKDLPASYWNLSAAIYAYVFAELARQGIDVAGESQLVGYPTQFPSVSMVDWNTGQPNARYWVLKLLHDHFAPGDQLLDTTCSIQFVYARGFRTGDGRRKVLLVNKRERAFDVTIPGAEGAQVQLVDQTTGFQPPASNTNQGNRITLRGFAVAVVTLAK